MITTALLTLAIVTQDQATLRAAPRDSAAQQAALWQGDALEIRGQRMDYLQVYDHRRERAGFIHVSQVRTVSLQPEDAPQLLSVVRFLRESPGAEALGIAYTAAYLKAAPAEAIGAEAFDALGTMAERLARRASMKHGKATSDVISAHMEVASFYGVSFKGYEQGGSMQLCYNGEAFRRVLALPSDAEQRARAALAVTRPDCMSPDLHPQDAGARPVARRGARQNQRRAVRPVVRSQQKPLAPAPRRRVCQPGFRAGAPRRGAHGGGPARPGGTRRGEQAGTDRQRQAGLQRRGDPRGRVALGRRNRAAPLRQTDAGHRNRPGRRNLRGAV
jgi:hypothetical protein